MLTSAFVSFVSFWLLLKHVPPPIMRKLVARLWLVDVPLHIGILWLFLGTSTHGLLQAEAAGIMFSMYLRLYRWAWGYEIRRVRYAGRFTRQVT